MHHGQITTEIAQGLRVLRERIAAAAIPSSKLDETLTLATWNIRDFGKRPRLDASIHFIAEILGQFDLIAVTEVRDNLGDLSRVLDVLGPYWRAVYSDYIQDAGGNRERMAYVYDHRAVVFTGLAAEPDAPRKKNPRTGEYLPTITWWRNPYMASFRAGNFDFVMIAAHIRWGSGAKARIAPLTELAKWIHKRRKQKHNVDDDFILVGDFNIPKENDALFKAITKRGLVIPEALRGAEHGSNLKRDKRYDQILYDAGSTQAFTGKAGALDFYAGDFKPLYPGVRKTKTQFTYELSDHLPLWAELDVDNDDEIIDQILGPA